MRDTSCKHFTGIQNKVCRKDIRYDSFNESENEIPCLPGFTNGRRPPGHCACFELQTPEEIAEAEAAIKAAIDRLTKTGPLIGKVKREHKGHDWRGIEVCPICQGRLHMTHAKYNGHVHGKCETKDCVSWME